jgi:osmotically-inducible protein OsmY
MRRKNLPRQIYLDALVGSISVILLALFAVPLNSQQPERRERTQEQQRQTQQQEPTLLQMHAADMSADLIVMRLADASNFYRGMEVKVNEGVATLSGRVPSQAAKRRALRIVRRTPGVYSVHYQITVDTSLAKMEPTSINQGELMEKVANSIAADIAGAKAGKDWWFEGWRVEGPDNNWNLIVQVDEPGQVVLDGELPQLDLIRKAIEAAIKVSGVQRLDSDLEIEPRRYRPYYPNHPGYAFTAYQYPYGYGPYAARWFNHQHSAATRIQRNRLSSTSGSWWCCR